MTLGRSLHSIPDAKMMWRRKEGGMIRGQSHPQDACGLVWGYAGDGEVGLVDSVGAAER